MVPTGTRLTAYPNSGFPEYVDGRSIYRATPDYFAAMALEMVAAGCGLVGGCCGTTPAHTAALRKLIDEATP